MTRFNRLAISSLEDVFLKIADGSDDFGGRGGGGNATAAGDAEVASVGGGGGADAAAAASDADCPGGSSLDQFRAIFWRRWVQVTCDL